MIGTSIAHFIVEDKQIIIFTDIYIISLFLAKWLLARGLKKAKNYWINKNSNAKCVTFCVKIKYLILHALLLQVPS